MQVPGHATADGTAAYRERIGEKAAEGHFRQYRGLQLSSIGVGTYLGAETSEDDDRYERAILRALELGINVIDTAVNYRCQRSERAVGEALMQATETDVVKREEVFVSTKGGFLPYDSHKPADARAYFKETFVDTGLCPADEIVADCHCLNPKFIDAMIDRSRANLRLQTIDVYYLHNPETQLTEVPYDEFENRLRSCFEVLEAAVSEGSIRMYGTATWNGYRQPAHAPDFLSLARLVGIAKEVGGDDHHFRAVQLPHNLSMSEASTIPNQPTGNKDEMKTVLGVAEDLGLYVAASASILQGKLPDPQAAIQFTRSTPGIGTALVGMKQLPHVEENALLIGTPPTR